MADTGLDSTADYIEVGIETSPTKIRDSGVDAVQQGNAGMLLRPGHPVWQLLDFVGELGSDLGQQMVDVARYRFRAFGRTIAGVSSVEATYATGTVSVTSLDPDPDGLATRTLDAGSQLSVQGTMFRTRDDFTFAPGDTNAIPVLAVPIGSAGSGLTGAAVLREPISWIDQASLVVVGTTTGGVDAETDDAYEQKLARRYRHMGRPTLAADFAERAREVVGVARVLVIDGYVPADHPDPGDPVQTDQERTVTLIPADENGAATSTGVKNDVQTMIEAEREINWVVYVVDPTYTTVNISATVTLWEGNDPADAEAQCEAALATFLNPGTWGAPPAGTSSPDWHDEPTVMRSEVFTVLNNIDPVRHVTALTINGSTTADLTLTGPGALPAVGTLAVTAS